MVFRLIYDTQRVEAIWYIRTNIYTRHRHTQIRHTPAAARRWPVWCVVSEFGLAFFKEQEKCEIIPVEFIIKMIRGKLSECVRSSRPQSLVWGDFAKGAKKTIHEY